MTEIERIARKLCEATAPVWLGGMSPDFIMRDGKPLWTIQADTVLMVLEAIREPSEAMKRTGAHANEQSEYSGPDDFEPHAAAVWQAMVDVLLAEPTQASGAVGAPPRPSDPSNGANGPTGP